MLTLDIKNPILLSLGEKSPCYGYHSQNFLKYVLKKILKIDTNFTENIQDILKNVLWILCISKKLCYEKIF
jgi:hypothetical protein